MSRHLGIQDLLLIGGIIAVVLICVVVIVSSMWADRKRFHKQHSKRSAQRS